MEGCEEGDVPGVSVRILGLGDVVVEGDDCANAVTITPGSGPGMIDIAVPAGHTLNGVDGPTSLDVALGAAPLQLALGDGDDTCEVARIDLASDLLVDLGEGDDFVRLFDLDIGGNVTVLGGAEADEVRSTSVRIDGSIDTDLGDGLNQISFDLLAGGNMSVLKSRTADTSTMPFRSMFACCSVRASTAERMVP